MAVLPELKSDRLRMQLSTVGERFAGFKTSIADDSRKRKQIDEQRYQEIKDSIVAVEKTLNQEIKRRVDANKTLQQISEQMANEMLDRLQLRIVKYIESLTVSMDMLITRCESLEKGLAQMKGDLPSKLAQDFAALQREAATLRQAFAAETKNKNERESLACKKLGELQLLVDSKFEAEIAVRQEQLNLIKREVERLVKGDEAHEQFRAFIMEELMALKNGLALATQAREQSDDEIIQAINQYTTALQKGLRTINAL
ncbi:SF-assemblin, putative [Eimeria acervulina]|uniref:SF-assemblin, putative n=1 Tax=Eimeria acervulina TaxID=5801 RepID=U6G950_EIMAC|nr:SF-assemblin, putative [Eimeria acervulina]CDI76042.1 SF-assemblin, putative [Eimeria acervulina]